MNGESASEDWTPERRRTLSAVCAHVLPLGDEAGDAGVDDYLVARLGEARFAAQAPMVLAALDELAERSGDTAFADLRTEDREALLRGLEADDNPYLAHALVLLVQLGLEGLLCDPAQGGNRGAVGWRGLGLSSDGPARRLRPGGDEP